MARVSKAEKLKTYKQRLARTRRWRSDQGYDDTWRRMIDLYRGKHWPKGSMNNQDLIVVNMAFSLINVVAPSVSVNHPKVLVRANSPENEDRAAFVEAVTNHLWRHHDFRTPFRRAVKDFLIIGHGWLKVGWAFKEVEVSLSETERLEMAERQMMEADMFAAEAPELAADLPSDEDIAAMIPTTDMAVVEDQPFVERISPFDIFVDPEATCMDDASWMAQRIIRPLSDVQDDKRYKPSTRKTVAPDAGSNGVYSDAPPQREEANDYTMTEELCTVWEYYDIKNNTLCVFAQNSDGYLVDPMPMPYASGVPFVMLRNYDVPDQFMPMGDLESIESMQLELDKTRTQLMNDRKRYARKYLYFERSFDGAGREALESEDDGRMVPVVDENRPLQDVVQPMPQVPVSPEIYSYSNIISSDINQVSGVSEYAQGGLPETRRTATEASIIADAQNARAADKLAIVEIAISHVARRVVQLLQQFMTGEQMARMTKADGADLWIPYSREDITGEYDFTVEAGSTQPMNDTVRKQQAISLLNAVAPLVGQVIDPQQLARHVLQSGFGIPDPEKFLMAPPQAPDSPENAGMAGVPPEAAEGLMPAAGQPNAPMGGVPPEMVEQLQNQMGMTLPSS